MNCLHTQWNEKTESHNVNSVLDKHFRKVILGTEAGNWVEIQKSIIRNFLILILFYVHKVKMLPQIATQMHSRIIIRHPKRNSREFIFITSAQRLQPDCISAKLAIA